MGTLTATTVPTAAQGAVLLASVTAEIDMHLRGRGYATPATDPEALASLKAIAMNGVAAKILKAAFPGGEGMGGDEGAAADFRTDYLDGLAFIDKGGLGSDSSGSGTGINFDFDEYSDVTTTSRKPEYGPPF
jgi:hypothetical protein